MRFTWSIFVAAAAAVPTAHLSHTVHEKRAERTNWVKYDELHDDIRLPVRIGLTQKNLHNIDEYLHEVATPGSPAYGKHYSAEEVVELFAPHDDTVDKVRAWLHSAGLDPKSISHSANKQWLQFDAKASEVGDLLKTKYHVYTHAMTGKTSVGCDEYSLPSHLVDHIDYITPGVKLFTNEKKKIDPSELAKRTFGVTGGSPLPPILKPLPQALTALLAKPLSAICDVAIIPECIMTMYNITQAKTAQPGNELGIFEDINDIYSQTDLNEFFLALQPRIPQGTHPKLEAVDGAMAPTNVVNAGPESDLDFQISYPLIYPQNSILFQTDDPNYEANYNFSGFFNTFLDAIDGSYCNQISPLDPPYPDPAPNGYHHALDCGIYKPTNVISLSYGGQEADLPVSYQKRQCNEYAKLGMQGVSILFASGDSGVAGPAGDDSANGCLGGGKIFSPDFPASCPYITAVGATYLPPGGSVQKDQEVAVTRFGSGGGFSNIYAQPSYQKTAVSTYFSQHNPPYKYYSTTNNQSVGAGGGIYNRIGRGYPDVAAVGDNIVIFNKGAPTLIGGTSASAPAFASILTRINDERLKAGKSTVGFVNPTLYSHPEVLHDITQGNNPGCGTNGFSASMGWDPVTGLGTPNYPAMLKLFMSQ